MKKYHKNPRTLTHKQQAQLLESLEDLGDLSGIVHNLDTDEIIGGNQRSSIFNVNTCEIEMTHEADTPDEQGTVGLGFVIWKGKRYTYRQVRWDPKRAERANIAANKLGGSWDIDVLANQFEIDDLLTWGFEPFELGIEPEKPEPGKDTPPETSRADELQTEWGTELGQLWACGQHRVICGDCTDADVVSRLMDGKRADAVITDPPYGIDFDPTKKRGLLAPSVPRPKILGDISTDSAERAYAAWSELSGNHIWWGGNYFTDFLSPSRCWLIWDKVNGNTDFADVEIAWCSDDKSARLFKHMWHGMLKDSERGEQRVHGTQKPVALMEWCIGRYDEAVVVADPFLGSGTTLIAAHNLNRICYGCELSESYTAVILQRYRDHTGIQPELIE